jgi:hypothetical protein
MRHVRSRVLHLGAPVVQPERARAVVSAPHHLSINTSSPSMRHANVFTA